ncbi:MAG: PEP-CTERM sorting domain-containing protein [Phycisphaerae bacterium]|nr:PEP-CTERM sorting domain-containing protein [Phycisphaerae bacterium]
MKAIKFAGVILALSAVSAMATDGVITWNVAGATAYETTDAYIEFFVNVDVTGNNQGLATFLYDIAITKVAGPAGGAVVGGYINNWPTLDWGAYLKDTQGYKSGATPIRGTIIDGGANGGPGINVLPSTGTLDTPGFIADVGAGILAWDPLIQGTKAWTGTHQWGVGMASRKDTLLVNPAGDYMVNYGYWTVADFVATNGEGIYKIEVLPKNGAVLLAEKNLNVADTGVTQTLALSDVVGNSLIFQVGVPEPATLLLLAGAGAFIRRRRHA